MPARSTMRGPARSKVIRARHAEGVASGHSLKVEAVRCDLGSTRIRDAQIAFLAIGVGELSPIPVACAVGQIWGLIDGKQAGAVGSIRKYN